MIEVMIRSKEQIVPGLSRPLYLMYTGEDGERVPLLTPERQQLQGLTESQKGVWPEDPIDINWCTNPVDATKFENDALAILFWTQNVSELKDLPNSPTIIDCPV